MTEILFYNRALNGTELRPGRDLPQSQMGHSLNQREEVTTMATRRQIAAAKRNTKKAQA
jgi:hypothetical protein